MPTAPRNWLILREPGRVPERKGPFPDRGFADTLREFMAARPTALMTVLTWHDGSGPDVLDAPECLEMLDGRSKPTARQHRQSTAAAFARRSTDDTERLNWLDRINDAANVRNGTVYGWKYDINHNRAALTDHNIPALSIREAIDAARCKVGASVKSERT